MKTKTLLSTMALTLATSAFAAGEKHDHAHEHKPLHGGVVVEVKDIDYELVAKPTVIQLHLRDHGKPADVSKATAKVTMLSGTEKQEVELKPAGDKLEATGNFKVGAGTKAVAVVSVAGKAATVRFSIK
ncbi:MULTISPECIES: hypothetical protein [Comamonadaceae]|jgi:hypothetical protein|uniref:hypothetical protein n=1 Tax=Comamonadaceae TaxID=80864 RepID=UPI00023FD100|nr:hypothetical protein [Acidovorax sp. NO-1]EHL22450.1 hypothetical protein KYG_11364 [Acidovorax sp. NO-1]MDP3133781.1 hypothetical protein [Burkholderiaceae bacterium]